MNLEQLERKLEELALAKEKLQQEIYSTRNDTIEVEVQTAKLKDVLGIKINE